MLTETSDKAELRALVFAETLKQIALVPGLSAPDAILKSVLQCIGKGEEECGDDCYVSLALLARFGFIGSSTVDESNVYFNAATILTPSRSLTSYVWDDAYTASLS